MLPPVLSMRPLFIAKPWGGARMGRLPGKQRAGHAPPADARIGEAWEVADLPEGTSVVDGGPYHGRSLRDVVAEHGAAVAGARAARQHRSTLRFPLLVKLIDAGEDLSIQVHPDDAFAAAHPGMFPKDEAWLVVDSAPDARVLHGLKGGVTREAFTQAVADGRPHTLLREVPVRAGDLFRIRPGTFHAIGGGSLLLEVQQPSDTTFRVWDWGRSGSSGAPRPLHTQEALAAGHFGNQDDPRVGAARRTHDEATAPGFVPPTVRTAHYQMSVHDVYPKAPLMIPRPPHEPAVVFALHGEAELSATGDGGPDRVLLPRGASGVVCASSADALVRSSVRATVVVLTTGEGP